MKRRGIVLLAGLTIVLAGAVPVMAVQPSSFIGTGLQPGSVVNVSKTLTGRLSQSDPDLIRRTDKHLVNVIIKFDLDPVANYKGGIGQLKATSPSVTGKSLKQNAAAVGAYKRYLSTQSSAIKNAIKSQVKATKFGTTFLTAFGGVSAQMPAKQAKKLLNIDGVAAVMYDKVEHPLTDIEYSADFIGATDAWQSLGGEDYAGAGVKIGVLDTGIWPEHPMLADPGGLPSPGGSYACEFGLSGDTYDDSFTCNDKLIGAYAFLDTNLLVNGPDTDEYCNSSTECSARDADGHGTHTSTTAAGDVVDSAIMLGVERGPVSGIAPGASVIMYRVCDEDGCYQSDSVAAVQQAIVDGIDVINFSISGGANAYSDAVEVAFFSAYAAGIMVNASAGNAGPGAATANHAGPWTNTVGASTWDKAFSSTLHLTATSGTAPLTLDVTGVTVTAGISSPTPVVLASAAPYSDAICNHPATPGTFAGVVVVCRRGTNARIEKGYNVLQGGAAGFILYNVGSTTDLESDNHFLPAIHVNDQSLSIATFVGAHTGVMATWDSGTLEPAQGDVMASFSSRGPLGDFIKPDVTAPGVQIMAGNSPHHVFSPADGLGPNGELYQAIAGTSMSSPHAAGVAALVKAAHPSWTPGMIKSALMTSSVQDVVKEDGITPADPFDDGAGSIRANRALTPTVTFDVNPLDYIASAYDPSIRINLNLPSINAPSMSGVITTWRTAQNVTGTQQRLHITTDAPAGTSITVSPSTLVLGPFQAKSFSVTIDASGAANGQYFGQITLNPQKSGYLDAVLPVAFNKQPGNVPMTNTCDDSSMDLGDTISCEVTVTNLTSTPANATVQVSASPAQVLKITDFSDGSKHGNGFTWSGELSPALAPEILDLDLQEAGDWGYQGYYGGICADGDSLGLSDESLVNLPVAFGGFSYGHEMYDTLMVDSNGYAVAGGGTSSDHSYSPIGRLPGAAAPNNVLAPYWTDLNPDAGGDVCYGYYYGDATHTWIVLGIEWNGVPTYGPEEPRSFELWIRLGSTEGIWFNYDPAEMGAGDPDAHLQVGAENRDGSSAVVLGDNVVPNTDGYEVITGSPSPGGSMTIDYDVLGHKIGTGKITALSATDVTPGVSKVVTTLTVH